MSRLSLTISLTSLSLLNFTNLMTNCLLLTRTVLLGTTLGLLCSAASLSTFYSYTDFENALPTGSRTFTEAFTDEVIGTPRLTLSICGTPDGVPTKTCVGPNINLFNLNSVNLTNNQVQGDVGFFEGVYFSNVFTLPGSVTAIGFDFSATGSSLSSTAISFFLGNDQVVSPFGNIVQPNPGPYSYPYTGFLGFVSDEPFNTLELGGAGLNGGNRYKLDNLTFDPTPEPQTVGLATAGLFGLLLSGTKLRIKRYSFCRNNSSRFGIFGFFFRN